MFTSSSHRYCWQLLKASVGVADRTKCYKDRLVPNFYYLLVVNFLHFENSGVVCDVNIRAVLGSDWREACLMVCSSAGDSWRLVVFVLI